MELLSTAIKYVLVAALSNMKKCNGMTQFLIQIEKSQWQILLGRKCRDG